jgi:acid phosphatase type 7
MKRIFLFLAFLIAFSSSALARDIVIFGDSQIYDDIQTAETAQRRVVDAVFQKNPETIFRVGDLVQDGHKPEQWVDFNKLSAKLLRIAEYFPALGNHEGNSDLYFFNFSDIMGQHWYSVPRQGIYFIVLNSNSPLDPSSKQYTWLESELSNLPEFIRFIIVLFHHPLFSIGAHEEDEKGLRQILVPLFEKYGVGAVFSGHDHNYQRFLYNGINYVVTGGGGSPLYNSTRTSPYLQKFSRSYHYCLLSRQGDSLKVSVFDVRPYGMTTFASDLIDEFNIPERK